MSRKILFLLLLASTAHGASFFETSYNYMMSFGRNVAPSFMSILECVSEADAWECAKERAGKLLDGWENDVEKERRSWEEEADAEVRTSGRSFEELPSKIGREITNSLGSLSNIVERSMARALTARKKHHEGGIDSITISTGSDKKKMKKKKQKPAKIHLIHPVMMPLRKIHKHQEKGRNFGSGVQSWVIGERALPVAENSTARKGRGIVSDMWGMGEQALDAIADQALRSEDAENGVADKSSVEEQRGKKKKKKKAILKLLILGAVLKAKIGTLLQILTFKLQVKFFVVALLGLAINLARLWIDIKNKHSQQPQKIIYYEHAQHQHHYDHEEEEHGWGPWSRSIFPSEDAEVDSSENSPYKAQERNVFLYNRPLQTRA